MVTGGAWWAGQPIYGAENLNRSSLTPDAKRRRAVGFTYGANEALRILLVCLPRDSVGPLTVHQKDVVGADDIGGAARCPRGERALAGGAAWHEGGADTIAGSLSGSTVTRSRKGWFAAGDNNGNVATVLRITVACVPA
jgi:hypothetical protein